MIHRLRLLTILLLLSLAGHSQLRLPHVLSDNMVLQRNSIIQVWGWGRAASTVVITASWSKDTVRTVIDGGGTWRTALPTIEAGGPYTLSVESGNQKITLQNLLLGDVWLCSGQSNMEWGGEQNLKEILDELPQVNDNQIRLLQVSRYAADYPQEDINDSWQVLNAENLRSFSAIGYFIAKEFRKELNVPIGIINASWGGTPAEVWTPSYYINNDSRLLEASEKQTAASFRPHRKGVLWNSMIYPLKNLQISGAFWYQGESNVGTWSSYDQLMQNLIASWRTAWNETLPFYFVQIAPFNYNNKTALASLLREQQMKTVQAVPKTGMVVVSDLVDNVADIHPIQKRAVAQRLAAIALHDHYGKKGQDYKSPLYKSYEIKGKTIVVDFDFVSDGLVIKDAPLTDMYIAGSDQVFHPAKGTVQGNKLVVSSTEVSAPVAVRFGFSETAMPNLFNSKGLPVAPFRTDNWILK